MRILITGATGFIGAPLARRLAAAGHEVFTVCREPGRQIDCGTPVFWDLAGGSPPANLPDRLDAVAHVAQSRNYRNFPSDVPEMFQVNVAGTAALLEIANRSQAGTFCLVSSGTVYEPYEGEISEDAALQPTSYLGASKLAAEVLARPYGSLFRLSVLRLFFPYGPGQKKRLVPELIDRVRQDRPIQLGADGEGLRFVPTFIEDIVEVIATAIDERWSGTFNVSSPVVVSLRQLAGTIGKIIDKEPVFEILDRSPDVIVPRLDRLGTCFDLRRFTSLEPGIRQTLLNATAACIDER